MAQLNVNLQDVTPDEGFEVRNPGWYEASIFDSDILTKPGKDPCIHLEVQIEDGKPGRVWDYLSLSQKPTKSGKTVQEISFQRLKSIAVAVGHRNPNYIADTEELHGLRCLVKLKVEKDPTGQYDDKNKITAYKPIGGKQPAQAQASAPEQVQQQQAPPAPKTTTQPMPWEAAQTQPDNDLPY